MKGDLNDLNATPGIHEDSAKSTRSIVSNDDNTQYPTECTSTEQQRRQGIHLKRTISTFVRDIEDNKRYLENEENEAVGGDSTREQSDGNSSATFPKVPFEDKSASVDLRGPRRQYVQHGDNNIMFIYESKESRTVNYCKQIGDKNIMVNLNVNSNLCQLVDQNNGMIPLDTKGEVWLEIKRRSQVRGELNSESAVPTCYTDNIQHGCTNTNIKEKTTNQPCYNGVNQGRSSPIEHTLSMSFDGDFPDDFDMEHYSTISVFNRNNSLLIKFSKNEDSVLDVDNLKESPILSHKKVIDFLTDRGNEFDVTIQDWEYDNDSEYKYDYIPAYYNGDVDMDLYSKPTTDFMKHPKPQLQRQKRLQIVSNQVETNVKDQDLYATVNKDRPQISDKQNYKEPEQKTQPARNKQLPDPPNSVPKRRGNKPPPLPIKTNPSYQSSNEATPPPLPQRPHMSTDKALNSSIPPQKSTPIPRSPATPVNTNVTYRQPSPRERRQLRLPPPPGSNYTDNLNQYEWYHGKLAPGVGSKLLTDREHGFFLVRDSNDNTDNHKFTIEFKDGNEIKKLMILKEDNKYYFSGYNNKKFESIVELIGTITTSGLDVKVGDTNTWKTIKLTPVPKSKQS